MSIIRNNKNYGTELRYQEPNLEDKSITTNGEYTADQGYDGLGTVTVNVQPNLTPMTATQNHRTYYPQGQWQGYSSVTVDVPDVQWPDYLTVTYVATDPTDNFQILNNTTGIDSYRIKGTQTWLSPSMSILVSNAGEVVIEYQLIDRTTIPGVFNGITTISKVEIPSGVTRVDGEGFNGCNNLVSIAPLTNLTYVPSGFINFTKVAFDKLYLDNGNRNWNCNDIAYTAYYALVDGRLFAYMNMDNQSPTVVDFENGIDGHTISEIWCTFRSKGQNMWNPSVIKFPSSLTNFSGYNMWGCTIGDVYFYSTTPPTTNENTVFNGATITGHIYVPAEAVSDYQNSGYFSDVADKIQAMP